MACRAVLFAITEEQAQQLQAARGDDQKKPSLPGLVLEGRPLSPGGTEHGPCLTSPAPAHVLFNVMRVARAILMAFLVAALAAWSLDCFAGSTHDEAMQCCDSMPCPQHNHDGSE